MAKLPRAIRNIIEKFEKLPGIGPKSAQRVVFYLLHHPKHELEDFAEKLVALKTDTVMCSQCHNVAESDPCPICTDPHRDKTLLCVVEQPLDLIALEKSDKYHGLYHVMHGAIDPLNNIGPDQIFLRDILKRLNGVTELILATNSTMEGEATSLYISEMVKKSEFGQFVPEKLKITRLGHGLPIGADIEYADGGTLARALESRKALD